MTDDTLDALVSAVLASANYRTVAPKIVRRVGAVELAKSRSLKDAIKSTKNCLHQVVGAYFEGKLPYAAWLERLSNTRSDDAAFKIELTSIMSRHTSTRERLPFLNEFYVRLFADLPPVRSVLDIACGLNPLTIPWMPLAPNATYIACDAFTDMAAFANDFLPIANVCGRVFATDLIADPPTDEVDVALALKVLPPLEMQDRGAGIRLLERLNARHIVVSFPRQSLGGRGKGMTEQYERTFLTTLPSVRWTVRRLEFQTELCFVLSS